MENEIIIDGVNVAECVYASNSILVDCEKDTCFCYENPNCYFKQLQRLKDKSEKISYRFKQTKKANKQYKIDIKNLQAELEQYKKSKQASYKSMQTKWIFAADTLRNVDVENEKLKKDIHNIYENCKCCDEFYMDKCSYIKKENKYKKALEDIDFIIDQSCILCNEEEMATCDLTTCRNGKMQMIKEIKNIIDEVLD